ncbi:coiled-coil domain-containing protein 189-like [Vespula squamosa]|uniref:Coiled-coil domain-containing protein 189-like n=1 Tax=Vespula squamosa TaxID=30214 RepID=A0ABD2BMS1_VESSQ
MLKNKKYQFKNIVESKKLERIKSVGRIFLSEPFVSINYKNVISYRKIKSEAIIDSNTNYDDLCGPWFYTYNPIHDYYDLLVPKLCVWELISFKDIAFVKEHQQDKDIILSFFKSKFSKYIFEERNDIFSKIVWEIFEVTRDNLFSIKCVFASIGLFYLTHRYFLSNLWYTMEDTYNFFCNTLLLHTVLNPPKSDEIFNLDECKLLFEVFHTVYMENLALLRLACLPCYNLKMSLDGVTTYLAA